MDKMIVKHMYDEEYLETYLGIRTKKNDVINMSWQKNRKRWLGYEPTEYAILIKLFEIYPFSQSDQLIDYGSGLGRTLIMASMYGCKKNLGIEIDDNSIDLCNRNINWMKMNNSIQIIKTTAETWQPIEGTSRFFFFNPFYMITFLKVFKNIIRYSKEYHQECLLYFVNLTAGYKDILDNCLDCEMLNIITDKKCRYEAYIYKLKV